MALVLILLSACAGGNGETETIIPEGDHVLISFDYEKQSGFSSNQFAVWIEDMDGSLVKTLYATRFTASGGYQKKPDTIPLWVERSGLASMTKSEADAVSGATPRAGALSYVWDLTGANGDAVPPGEYRFFVEGSLRWKNRVLYSGTVDIGGGSSTVPADAEYFYEGSDGRPALTDDADENAMIRNVTAIIIEDRR
jgi:hypothetical protein